MIGGIEVVFVWGCDKCSSDLFVENEVWLCEKKKLELKLFVR